MTHGRVGPRTDEIGRPVFRPWGWSISGDPVNRSAQDSTDLGGCRSPWDSVSVDLYPHSTGTNLFGLLDSPAPVGSGTPPPNPLPRRGPNKTLWLIEPNLSPP